MPPSASLKWLRTSGSTLPTKAATFGATILTDCKNGFRQTQRQHHPPDPAALAGDGQRFYRPGQPGFRPPRDSIFGIAGHRGDWHDGQTDWQAYRLNQPLIAFESAKHDGALGKQFSLITVSNPRIQVMALKKAEASDEMVLRMVEMDGRPRRMWS